MSGCLCQAASATVPTPAATPEAHPDPVGGAGRFPGGARCCGEPSAGPRAVRGWAAALQLLPPELGCGPGRRRRRLCSPGAGPAGEQETKRQGKAQRRSPRRLGVQRRLQSWAGEEGGAKSRLLLAKEPGGRERDRARTLWAWLAGWLAGSALLAPGWRVCWGEGGIRTPLAGGAQRGCEFKLCRGEHVHSPVHLQIMRSWKNWAVWSSPTQTWGACLPPKVEAAV